MLSLMSKHKLEEPGKVQQEELMEGGSGFVADTLMLA